MKIRFPLLSLFFLFPFYLERCDIFLQLTQKIFRPRSSSSRGNFEAAIAALRAFGSSSFVRKLKKTKAGRILRPFRRSVYLHLVFFAEQLHSPFLRRSSYLLSVIALTRAFSLPLGFLCYVLRSPANTHDDC